MIHGLGERLQKQRTAHKLSQREVASALNVSPVFIFPDEKGERTPSLEMLIALARLYHCSTDYLLGFDKSNTDTINVSMLTEKQKNLLQLFLEEL